MLNQTIGQSLESTAQRWPDREAVVFLYNGLRKTFSQFQQDVCSDFRSFHACNYIDILVVVISCFCVIHWLQVDKAAAGLLALGLKQGDRLGVWGPNTYEWILFQFASAKAGIIMVSFLDLFIPFKLHFWQRSRVFGLTALWWDYWTSIWRRLGLHVKKVFEEELLNKINMCCNCNNATVLY